MFKAHEIKPGIWWVGALEWNERCIHGFTMPNGSTNNAYLIMDEHVTLVDTCSHEHCAQLLQRISDVVDPERIEYIISNHSEKDHAGSLREVLARAPQAKVVTSTKGEAILRTYLGEGPELIPVKTGDELSIGTRTLTFVGTPMVHWPDNMSPIRLRTRCSSPTTPSVSSGPPPNASTTKWTRACSLRLPRSTSRTSSCRSRSRRRRQWQRCANWSWI